MGSSCLVGLLQPPEGRTMGFVHFFSRSRSPLSGRRRNLIINAPILIVSLIFIDIRQHLEHSAFIENHPSPFRRHITPSSQSPRERSACQPRTPVIDNQLKFTGQKATDNLRSPPRHAFSALTAAPGAPTRRPRRLRRPLCYDSGACRAWRVCTMTLPPLLTSLPPSIPPTYNFEFGRWPVTAR